ncbi:MAG: penicillin-binding protein 2 [Candidatus Omnitrophica bacterium]|nr:penicillin-binding protein 2 [Candidatus Omnitrophota bacterium]
MFRKSQAVRLRLIFSFFFILYILLAARLIGLQLFAHPSLLRIAESQHYPTLSLEARRGAILDRQGKPFALTHATDSLFVASREIPNKEEISKALSQRLHLSQPFLLERLRRDKSFVWIKRKLPFQLSSEIKQMKLKGVDFVKETKRVYPGGPLASHILGFTDIDHKGLEGIERYYDRLLRGEDGYRQVLRDAKRRALPSLELKYQKPVDGLTVVLTLDEVIQHIAERELDKAYKKWKASGATIIVMDPWNGEILALANRPAYDLNSPGSSSGASRRNRAITDLFEPGSVFKIITAATALQEGVVKEEDKIFCENGAYRVSNHILHDHHPQGTLTFRQVIEKSSNIGTVKVAQKIGPARLHQYILAFGFGQKTGVDLPGEIPGVAVPPKKWSGTSIANIPIGQGIGVTTLQLASAMAVIANGGKWVRPHLLKEILSSEGGVIQSYSKEPGRPVLREEVAERLREILVGAVGEGTGKLAKLEGYDAGGKTGTSQKLDEDGRYSHSKYVASFVGFAPSRNPRIVVAVMLDEPHGAYFGGVVAAPVFQNVAGRTLRYLEIPHEQKTETQMVLHNESKKNAL